MVPSIPSFHPFRGSPLSFSLRISDDGENFYTTTTTTTHTQSMHYHHQHQTMQNATSDLGELLVSVRPPDTEELDKEKSIALKKEGDASFVSKDFNKAYDHYTESIKHDASSAVIWANRSAAALRLEKYRLAYWDARISRSIDHHYAKAWYREGEALRGLERFEDAAQVLYEGYMHNQDSEVLAHAVKEAVEAARKQLAEEKTKRKKMEAEGGSGVSS